MIMSALAAKMHRHALLIASDNDFKRLITVFDNVNNGTVMINNIYCYNLLQLEVEMSSFAPLEEANNNAIARNCFLR
eukprot:scaffold93181_cov16-Prasinocladus_malaysianus.AAC.1